MIAKRNSIEKKTRMLTLSVLSAPRLANGKQRRFRFVLLFRQVDVPYQYLTFFMEDDEELERIGA